MPAPVEHVDVIIVGAGLSGIGAAHHLQTLCPDRDYVILEGRERLGGTWDLFRYPGVRSDSDMHTLGYSFRPWTEAKTIADGPAIRDYIAETAREYAIDTHIRYQHHVEQMQWDSQAAQWTVTCRVGETAEERVLRCSFVLVCAGYYSYERGHEPDFPSRNDFGGIIVHPQQWPEDLDYDAKRVVVIGSGATAITLVPALAERADHVVMLQRSPTYVVSRPDHDRLAIWLRRLLPDRLAYSIVRARNTAFQQFVYRRTRTDPAGVRDKLLAGVRAGLGDDFDVERHFTPDYDPWDQRLCLIPNGDLYAAIRSGRASVVTDTIERFTARGVELSSGEHLDADIIVTATGLELLTLGGIDVVVDGRPTDFASTFTYRGLAYSDVPNLISTFGYINASWTLRADLVSEFACRVLNHLRDTGCDQVTPRLRPTDHDMAPRAWIEGFSPGYMQRAMPLLPRQGDREPWTNPQDYSLERRVLRRGQLEDGVLQFTRARVSV